MQGITDTNVIETREFSVICITETYIIELVYSLYR